MIVRSVILGLLVFLVGVLDAQNVGVGTTTPTHNLHVVGTIRFESLGSIGPAGKAILFTDNQGVVNIVEFTGNPGDVLLGDASWGNLSVLTTVNSQFPIVGDGSTSNPITFASGNNAGQVWIWNGSSWQLVVLGNAVGNAGYDSVCASAAINFIQKWTGTELCNTIIYENGNEVGIGTTTPTARLHIQAPSTYANPLFVIRHDTNSASNPFFIVTKDGRVGVGTNTPVMKFEIDYPTASPAFVVTSDIRLKKDIVPLSREGNVLDKIENLHGVYYYWNETYRSMGKGNDRRQIGLIAQEVMDQFPELVYEWADGSGYYMVDYEKMVPILLEAIKELKSQLDQEQMKNSQLQSRINQLEQEIEEIKNHIKAFSSAE